MVEEGSNRDVGIVTFHLGNGVIVLGELDLNGERFATTTAIVAIVTLTEQCK